MGAVGNKLIICDVSIVINIVVIAADSVLQQVKRNWLSLKRGLFYQNGYIMYLSDTMSFVRRYYDKF